MLSRIMTLSAIMLLSGVNAAQAENGYFKAVCDWAIAKKTTCVEIGRTAWSKIPEFKIPGIKCPTVKFPTFVIPSKDQALVATQEAAQKLVTFVTNNKVAVGAVTAATVVGLVAAYYAKTTKTTEPKN